MNLKQVKFEHILEASKAFVLKEGLSHLTISSLAKELNIGEATIYRYFGTKTKLIIEIGVSLWEDAYQLLNNKKSNKTGYENIKIFYFTFYDMFTLNKNIFKVIDELDQMLSKKSVNDSLLDSYNEVILKVKNIFDNYYQQGIEDNSVNSTVDSNLFYFSSTHMLLGLCKKLATQYHLIPCDECVEDKQQIIEGIQMVLKYIKSEEK